MLLLWHLFDWFIFYDNQLNLKLKELKFGYNFAVRIKADFIKIIERAEVGIYNILFSRTSTNDLNIFFSLVFSQLNHVVTSKIHMWIFSANKYLIVLKQTKKKKIRTFFFINKVKKKKNSVRRYLQAAHDLSEST